MKNKISTYIVMVIILITIQACTTRNVTQPTIVEQETTKSEEQTNLIITSTPSQEAGGVDILVGPESIDLQNPALYITNNTTAYTFNATMDFSGMDTTGAVKEISIALSEETQTLPQSERHFLVKVTGGEGSAETVIIGDDGYSVYQEACFPFLASSSEGQSASDGMPKLQEMITGQAYLVESGVMVNGFNADKYELTNENMVANDELTSAFVYVARVGGFITQFEIQGRTKTDYQGFDSTQYTDISTSHTYIPIEDGTLGITIPSVCVN